MSIKPKIIVCNVDEKSLSKGNIFTEKIKENYPKEQIIFICADIEDQIMGLNKEEQESFMKEIGLDKTGLKKLIRAGYDLLNLDTFLLLDQRKVEHGLLQKILWLPKQRPSYIQILKKNLLKLKQFLVMILSNMEVWKNVKKMES